MWSVAEVEGLVHDVAVAPDVPGPGELRSAEELAEGQEPPFPFWQNFDTRPIEWSAEWPPAGPLEPRVAELDAVRRVGGRRRAVARRRARVLLLVDLPSWPSAHRPHAWQRPPFIAPTPRPLRGLPRLVPDEPWLLVEGTSPVAADGLIGFTSRLWTTTGALVASGSGQTLCRRVGGP